MWTLCGVLQGVEIHYERPCSGLMQAIETEADAQILASLSVRYHDKIMFVRLLTLR